MDEDSVALEDAKRLVSITKRSCRGGGGCTAEPCIALGTSAALTKTSCCRYPQIFALTDEKTCRWATKWTLIDGP